MIEFEGVTLAYAAGPALRDVTFAVPEGELVLVVGPTGSGKTSLLRCLDAEVTVPEDPASPHLTGRVLVDGVDLHLRGRDGRPLVGLVRQDPAQALVTGDVESVIAAAVRVRAADSHAGQRQVEETLDLLGIADLRARPVSELSGGQQQRVAIGVAVVAAPRVLVLDEPTSALDPVAAEEVLAILHRLVHDVGTTVVVAEHRLERVVHHADSVLLVDAGSVTGPHEPGIAMTASTLRPPVVELGVRLGWEPLPLSVRDARRAARSLRTMVLGTDAGTHAGTHAVSAKNSAKTSPESSGASTAAAAARALVDAHRVSLVRDGSIALRSVSLSVGTGEVVALMGRNGAGKSTLLAALAGALPSTSGRLVVEGTTALAPQDPSALLTSAPLATQLAAHDATHGLVPGATARLLGRLAPELRHSPAGGDVDDRLDHAPTDLSEGQRMCVALSLVLARDTAVVLLDEPTRGLDYAAKARLAAILTERAAAGRAVVVATHDVELAAEVATRVAVLAEGEVVADGPAGRVLSDSPAFAPQVAKVMHPARFLRVGDVVVAAAVTPH